jgi:hypothetical protein
MRRKSNWTIHEEVKEELNSGDAGEKLKFGDTGELNNSEIRISKRQKWIPITKKNL